MRLFSFYYQVGRLSFHYICRLSRRCGEGKSKQVIPAAKSIRSSDDVVVDLENLHASRTILSSMSVGRPATWQMIYAALLDDVKTIC
jgi:hypothetical protein